MPQNKPEKPSVVTYADHEVITPPNRLRGAIKTTPASKADDEDPVARAEQALKRISGEFSAWMDEECARLDRARIEVKAKGFNKTTQEALFHAAHDIKGEAATFGFSLVAPPADSLCRLIEHTPDMTRIPLELVDQHVDAIRAIVRENARTDIEEVARTLTRRLREVTDEFLRHENRDRPDILKIVMAPSLVPSERSD
jgi:chemotaxis protein histidine kinase CheA